MEREGIPLATLILITTFFILIFLFFYFFIYIVSIGYLVIHIYSSFFKPAHLILIISHPIKSFPMLLWLFQHPVKSFPMLLWLFQHPIKSFPMLLWLFQHPIKSFPMLLWLFQHPIKSFPMLLWLFQHPIKSFPMLLWLFQHPIKSFPMLLCHTLDSVLHLTDQPSDLMWCWEHLLILFLNFYRQNFSLSSFCTFLVVPNKANSMQSWILLFRVRLRCIANDVGVMKNHKFIELIFIETVRDEYEVTRN